MPVIVETGPGTFKFFNDGRSMQEDYGGTGERPSYTYVKQDQLSEADWKALQQMDQEVTKRTPKDDWNGEGPKQKAAGPAPKRQDYDPWATPLGQAPGAQAAAAPAGQGGSLSQPPAATNNAYLPAIMNNSRPASPGASPAGSSVTPNPFTDPVSRAAYDAGSGAGRYIRGGIDNAVQSGLDQGAAMAQNPPGVMGPGMEVAQGAYNVGNQVGQAMTNLPGPMLWAMGLQPTQQPQSTPWGEMPYYRDRQVPTDPPTVRSDLQRLDAALQPQGPGASIPSTIPGPPTRPTAGGQQPAQAAQPAARPPAVTIQNQDGSTTSLQDGQWITTTVDGSTTVSKSYVPTVGARGSQGNPTNQAPQQPARTSMSQQPGTPNREDQLANSEILRTAPDGTILQIRVGGQILTWDSKAMVWR